MYKNIVWSWFSRKLTTFTQLMILGWASFRSKGQQFRGSLLRNLPKAKVHKQLLAPQSSALRISAYRDFQSNPLIAFEHLSLSKVIRNSASRP